MLIVLCLLLITELSRVMPCPSKERLHPCTCESTDYTNDIRCEGILNEEELRHAVATLRGVKDIFSFTIQDAVLSYIPHDLFMGVEFVELDLFASSIMEISDTDVAFEGLEDTLEILSVRDCYFMNEWDWSLLRNMRKLAMIDIVEGDLQSIDETIKELNNFTLKYIYFSHNEISYVHDSAFANFSALRYLGLNNNLIKDVKRSMLPNPAPNLQKIDLSYNQIRRLPKDFFVNMPSLVNVVLTGNKILTLDEQVFAPVWEHLDTFQAMGNPLRCDCTTEWILKKKMPSYVRADCDQPRRLKGGNLTTLGSDDLWC